MKFLLAVLAAMNLITTSAQSIVATFDGSTQVNLPPIGTSTTPLGDLAGTKATLECSDGTTYVATLSSTGVDWMSGTSVIGQLRYSATANSINNPVSFDVTMMGLCDDPILTLDARTACNSDVLVVFDTGLNVGGSSPGSGAGLTLIEGGGCSNDATVAVTFSYAVGLDGAAPVGDLWQVVKFDFSSAECTFDTDDGTVRIFQDLDETESKMGICNTGSDGDPHIKTWNGQHFDYMGECDLVLLHAPNFDDGKSLDIHIRTTIEHSYSYIETAAMSIHGEVLEVSGFGEHSLNGEESPRANENTELTIGGYPIIYTKLNKNVHRHDVILSPKENITFISFKNILAVHMQQGSSLAYFNDDVSGVMGNHEGELIGRDGSDMSGDLKAFAEEWQVHDFEPMLFKTERAPQFPAKCLMPTTELMTKRRLEESAVSRDAAEMACGDMMGAQFEDCVEDVMAFGDLELASAGAL